MGSGDELLPSHREPELGQSCLGYDGTFCERLKYKYKVSQLTKVSCQIRSSNFTIIDSLANPIKGDLASSPKPSAKRRLQTRVSRPPHQAHIRT